MQRLSRVSSIFSGKSNRIFNCQHNLQEIRKEREVSIITPSPVKSLQISLEIHTCPFLSKYNTSSSKGDQESEDEEDPDFKDERDSKVLKTKVNSLRADLLVRAGLGVARNKIEIIFYESKIRVNGKKLAKKSTQLNVGDEIDIIKGFSQINPSHLVVSRVLILSANVCEDGYKVNLRRYKSLLVENYAGVNAFKSSEVKVQ